MSHCSLTESNCSSNLTHDDVKHYYGKHLSNTKDLKTSACAAPAKPLPKYIKDALSEIHEDITSRYFGCGLTVPQCLENCRILDLGSGSGRDCYILSKLVGPKGHVTGVDMTDEQLELSRKYIDYHMQKFGFQQPNVSFTKGYIENMKEADLQDETFDVAVSNCVINLCPDKKAVLSEVYRVLKNGGEMFFSDMYINKTLTEELKKNKMVWGEGIGGALLWKDLFQFAEEIGFSPPRLVTSRDITFNKELEDVVGDYRLASATFRLFKLPEDAKKEKCLAIYNGGVTGYENEMQFDANFSFKEGQAVEVDEELCGILKVSRFTNHFSFLPLENGSESKKEIISDPFQFADCSQETNSCNSSQPKECLWKNPEIGI
ncbi:arsenite methyltransferase-like [Rhinoderma darwinii]|uniref:arsenite methyltransferase-like n=1 Tax=Rhinoderma darwinii TaxID=43563 RepID=UPI003F681314